MEALYAEIKKKQPMLDGICDLSFLDGENKKEDYIFPICHNQPIKINQEQAIKALKIDIIDLTDAIVKNFAVRYKLKKQLMFLDTKFCKTGIKFFDLVY